MYGYIYKTVNLINGKIYIGQHRSSVFDSNYLGSGKLIVSAINKYGKNNFTVNVLEECYDKDSLNEREKHWIKQLNSRNLAIGYNISEGGDGGDIFHSLSVEQQNSIRKKCGQSYSKIPEHTRKEIAIKVVNTRRKNGSYKVFEQTRKKLSIAHKGKKLPQSVIQKRIKSRQGYKHSEKP